MVKVSGRDKEKIMPAVALNGIVQLSAKSPGIMRTLKTILIVLLSLVVLLAILGAMGSSAFKAGRSVTIHAPAAAAFANIRSLQRMDEWGPWREEDPGMTNSFEGPEGQVGSISRWKGASGAGSQEVIAIEEDKSMRTRLIFEEPWRSEYTGIFEVESMGDSCRVTWGMEGENGWAGRIFSVFMDPDQMVGPMFEKGLANLKTLTEGQHLAVQEELKRKTFGGYVIETVERPSMTYLGKRSVVKWTDLKSFFGKWLPASFEGAGKSGIRTTGPPTAVYFMWDDVKKQADLLAGVPVEMAGDIKVPGLDVYTVPACKVLVIPYWGAYEGIGAAHEAMDAMIKANGLTHYGNVFEEYVTDPMAEPDTSKWLTNVLYMVK